jgi:F-type H+-transporting ATPase subunit b
MEFVTPNVTNLITTAVGFLLFVWVLAKFAWGPILDLLDQRRDTIADDYAKAEQNLADAESLKGEFELKLQDIKVIEREKVQEAVKRGEGLADGIVTRANVAAADKAAKAEQDIELETHKAQLELRDSVVAMALGAAEKVIGEKLDEGLHRKLIEDYIAGITTVDGGAKDA